MNKIIMSHLFLKNKNKMSWYLFRIFIWKKGRIIGGFPWIEASGEFPMWEKNALGYFLIGTGIYNKFNSTISLRKDAYQWKYLNYSIFVLFFGECKIEGQKSDNILGFEPKFV